MLLLTGVLRSQQKQEKLVREVGQGATLGGEGLRGGGHGGYALALASLTSSRERVSAQLRGGTGGSHSSQRGQGGTGQAGEGLCRRGHVSVPSETCGRSGCTHTVTPWLSRLPPLVIPDPWSCEPQPAIPSDRSPWGRGYASNSQKSPFPGSTYGAGNSLPDCCGPPEVKATAL